MPTYIARKSLGAIIATMTMKHRCSTTVTMHRCFLGFWTIYLAIQDGLEYICTATFKCHAGISEYFRIFLLPARRLRSLAGLVCTHSKRYGLTRCWFGINGCNPINIIHINTNTQAYFIFHT